MRVSRVGIKTLTNAAGGPYLAPISEQQWDETNGAASAALCNFGLGKVMLLCRVMYCTYKM